MDEELAQEAEQELHEEIKRLLAERAKAAEAQRLELPKAILFPLSRQRRGQSTHWSGCAGGMSQTALKTPVNDSVNSISATFSRKSLAKWQVILKK